MAANKDPRDIVLNMLSDTLEKGMFSDAVLAGAWAEELPDARDRAFVRRLYIGVLERLIYIDHIINHFSSIHSSKMKPVILNILRTAVYQLIFMDSVPDYAVLNEAARLAGRRGFKGLVRFVNALLRSIQSGWKSIEGEMPDNVRLSVPKWIYEMLISGYGREQTDAFLLGTFRDSNGLTARVNTSVTDMETVIRALENEGCNITKCNVQDSTFRLAGFDSLTDLSAFKEGLFSIQDASSVRAALAGCRALEKRGSEPGLILDVCAAPGGKSICAAQVFPGARVISRDVSEKKKRLIDENAKRLMLHNIESQVHDALVFDESLAESADLVIADLPCSGIGVIGKKPDIKFRIRKKDVTGLAKLQRDILSVVQKYVKKGGILSYSTCTVINEENQENAEWFSDNFDFELLGEEQVLPDDGDGFYTAIFQKR